MTAGVGVVGVDAGSGERMGESGSGPTPQPNGGGGEGKKVEGGVGAGESTGGMPEMLASREGKIVGISRGDMRRIFMGGCERYIRWSHHVVGYESTKEGVRAVLADGGRSEEGCMLVGGEGIYSKVAKQLSGGRIRIFDTGARGKLLACFFSPREGGGNIRC